MINIHTSHIINTGYSQPIEYEKNLFNTNVDILNYLDQELNNIIKYDSDNFINMNKNVEKCCSVLKNELENFFNKFHIYQYFEIQLEYIDVDYKMVNFDEYVFIVNLKAHTMLGDYIYNHPKMKLTTDDYLNQLEFRVMRTVNNYLKNLKYE